MERTLRVGLMLVVLSGTNWRDRYPFAAMPDRRLAPILIGIVLLVAACSSPGQPTASDLDASAAETDGSAGMLPPGCEPIRLVSPIGAPVELEGIWVHAVEGQEMPWWIRTAGNCVWGAGLIPAILTPDDISGGGSPHSVQSLNGHLGSDFVISGEILTLALPSPFALGPQGPYSALRMLVEFDGTGAVILREDRAPGAVSPRCPDPPSYCPAPLVLERAD